MALYPRRPYTTDSTPWQEPPNKWDNSENSQEKNFPPIPDFLSYPAQDWIGGKSVKRARLDRHNAKRREKRTAEKAKLEMRRQAEIARMRAGGTVPHTEN